MRKFLAVFLAALMAASMIHVSPAYARSKKPPEKEFTGTVKVTKSGDTVTTVELTADDSTVYSVKLDTKGKALAKDYDGQTVKVKAKQGLLDGKKELIVDVIETTKPKPAKK